MKCYAKRESVNFRQNRLQGFGQAPPARLPSLVDIRYQSERRGGRIYYVLLVIMAHIYQFPFVIRIASMYVTDADYGKGVGRLIQCM